MDKRRTGKLNASTKRRPSGGRGERGSPHRRKGIGGREGDGAGAVKMKDEAKEGSVLARQRVSKDGGHGGIAGGSVGVVLKEES